MYSIKLTNTCEGVVYLVNFNVRSLQLYQKWVSLHVILKIFALLDVFKEYVKTYFPEHLSMTAPEKKLPSNKYTCSQWATETLGHGEQ